MRKLKIILLFTSLFWWRWVSLRSPLPPTWTPESKIRFTATIINQVEYTDSKTIIRSGMWYIKMTGYAEIIPGSRVSFVGKVTPKVLAGKITQIVMTDPTFEVVEHTRCVGTLHTGCVMVYLGQLRAKWIQVLEKTLPEPMSSLSAGILLGVKGQMPNDFYQSLVNTGTLHVIAASGFNVMIVASVLMGVLSRVAARGWAIAGGIMGILVYVLISGAGASVVRAGIMGSLALISFYFGRPAEARRLLWITASIMLLVDPLLIFDIGFQLSFTATAGLLYFAPFTARLPQHPVLKDYLYPTLAASASTMPIILYHFGRVSWISPIVNMLVLPVAPLIMALTSLILIGGQWMAWIAYAPLAYLVWVIKLFG